MNKILQIAWREFAATVLTKGFLIGLLVVPLIMGAMTLLIPLMIDMKSPPVEGGIAVFDASGQVWPGLRAELGRDAFIARRQAMDQAMSRVLPGVLRGLRNSPSADTGMNQILGEVPVLELSQIADAAQIESEKQRLRLSRKEPAALLAVLVIDANAVAVDAGQTLGSYRMFVRDGLNVQLLQEIRTAVRKAIVDTRLAAEALDADKIRALLQVNAPAAQVISAKGARIDNPIANQLLPMAFMALILVAVMTAGQQLMTSTIEEKSSRVVELLLAAVSPTELMAGKILGQMAVGLLMLVIYGGVFVLALFAFSAAGLIKFSMLVYMLIYFLIAFATLAALMAAIGAAVNELREAQALLTPVVLVALLPMLAWMPISNNPNSALATTLSFIPAVSPFTMILRLASSSPPPFWQIALSILIGLLGVVAAIWFAGKVFRVGLLMHGKPPNLLTLIRWVRMT